MSKTAPKTVLVADDEEDVVRLVTGNLKAAGFEVVGVADGLAALETARKEHPDLVVLDLMLPGMPGLDVCKALKKSPDTAHIPIVMLTARADEIDRIVGFELGADDYITKPFSPRELVLRVQSVLRRKTEPEGAGEREAELKLGSIAIDRSRCEATVKGKRLDLTATEFKLLTTLVERRGRVQSRDALLNDVWGYESIIDTRTVDTHIRRLREKLGPAADYIETIRGFGYRMMEA